MGAHQAWSCMAAFAAAAGNAGSKPYVSLTYVLLLGEALYASSHLGALHGHKTGVCVTCAVWPVVQQQQKSEGGEGSPLDCSSAAPSPACTAAAACAIGFWTPIGCCHAQRWGALCFGVVGEELGRGWRSSRLLCCRPGLSVSAPLHKGLHAYSW